MLAFAVPGKCFKRITDAGQVAECLRSMEHRRFAEGKALDGTELPAGLFIEDLFGFSTLEGNDQNPCCNALCVIRQAG